jgi:hypothetical protein
VEALAKAQVERVEWWMLWVKRDFLEFIAANVPI